MPAGARTDCVPSLQGNLSPGDFVEPLASAGVGVPWSAPDRSCGRVPGVGQFPTGTPGFLGFPARRRGSQGGEAPSMHLSVPVSSRAAVRRLGRSTARVRAPELWQNRRWELLLSLFKKKKKQVKRFSNLFGERSDAQRTSPLLLPLLLSEPPCGLGRISLGAHPHQRQPAGEAGPAQLVSPVE